MATELSIPDPSELDDVVGTLRSWQRDEAPIQLHPGDLGWHWRFGADELASTVRTWSRNGEICAIGFLDGPDVLRMTVAPEVWLDDELAHDVVTDLSAPERGVLPAGKVSVEVPDSTRIQDLLSEYAWTAGDPWTPLHLASIRGRVGRCRRVVDAEMPSVLGELGVSSSLVRQAAEGTGSETTGWLVVPRCPDL